MPDHSPMMPRADHLITIEQKQRRVTVKLSGKIIAETERALTLQEADYPAVQYIPRDDVDMTNLALSHHRTHCPYKGNASYFHAMAGNRRIENVAWSYEAPYDAVGSIRDYIAFYPDRVDRIEGAALAGRTEV
ncbi:DUF427 domain-containing protein [Novosphingobium sp. 9U]|uniref:DUF427 domain-containing protein n=1 Tax=Novosphingobium sp. 9U TaxID=2653158 RepID=UPI0012F384A0|nr:DUF427 domain-containing protein [Novosphingobium sp. 9U]VWX50941.1 conserved hypothetical protein [Novosphingobium sp. 9U]